jgi:4-amino-4-deoxy-L-arabinose transferase-like glycosyltransferase
MIEANKNQKVLWFLLIVVIFIGALGIRLYDFDDPPLDFHPARQLHSALIARAVYLNHNGSLPDFDAEYEHESIMRGVQEQWIEPPIFEYLTASLYQLIGDADLRVPRACAICFWLIGAFGLYRLSRRFLGKAGVLASLSFFLFFPYGVFASRSFQPDPLMIMLIIWALEALCAWDEKPTILNAVLAGVLAGMAILVKQVCVFPVGLAMAFFVVSGRGFGKAIRNIQVWVIAVLSFVPVLIYNFWGYFIQGFLVQQYQGRFNFVEIISPSLYIRWTRKLEQVFGLPLVIGSLIGTLTISQKKYRMLWLGYFLGYILYGMALPHHIGTHDYYQLLLFPLIAVGLGKLIDCVFAALNTVSAGRLLARALITVVLAAICGWWIADSAMTLKRNDYRIWPQLWQELAAELDPYEGQINTIGLMDDYGSGMIYWGLRTPVIWEENVEKSDESEAMEKIRRTMMNREFLIVTDFESYYRQPRLQRWLMQNTQVYRQTADYLIFDLREIE